MDDLLLPRPVSEPTAGPLDDRFWDLVESHFRDMVKRHPVFATYQGIHDADGELENGTRDAVEQEIADSHRLQSDIQAIDPAGLSDGVRLERELALHNVRRELFDMEVHRVWERRSTAMDAVGDALFAPFARNYAPLAERLASLTSRIEGVPNLLEQHRSRATAPQVRLWQELEIDSGEQIPGFFGEIRTAGHGVLDERAQARLDKAVEKASAAVTGYLAGIKSRMGATVELWALGSETLDGLVSLRAFDGLDASHILEIGHEQLALNKAARVEDARRIDPSVTEPVVVDRVKSNHPATFEKALATYEDAMLRARAHIVAHELATMPPGEQISVIPTPEYLRNVIPFAAYFEPAKFEKHPTGIYVVTPSVGDDPNAMREHNYASISNTSVHEAYPGHHLQLSAATRHPSLVRLLTDAPEFVEGWGMYSEQMMREQGFDAGPEFLLAMHTDAIWRACRIILDIRMHRGEISVDDATAFLIEHTAFEHANAQAEVFRYTYTPTYQLSYLLGKVMLLQLRADEQYRLGDKFSLKGFHDTLLRNGSLPISFHRRLLAAEAANGSGNDTGSGAARANQ
ncbi:MAG: DUF885 domain-containing protein [Candidatus Limnocylindrales bacterium]|jgi:uncharacterized protein (DUF885 family)